MIRYSLVLHCVFYLYALIVALVFAFTGQNDLVNVQTILLSIAMAIAFSVMIMVPDRASLELRLAFASFSALFLCPAVLAYMVYPGRFPFGGGERIPSVTVVDVNRALLFIVLGNVMIMVGLCVGANIVRGPSSVARTTPPWVPVGRLITVGLLFIGLELFTGLYYGRFSTEVGAEGGGLFFLTRLFGSDAFTIVAIISLFHFRDRLSRREKSMLIVMLVAMAVHRTLTGARSSVFMMLTLCFITMLDLRGDFAISRRAISLVAIAILATVVAFPVATVVREYWVYSSQTGSFSPSEFFAWRKLDRAGQRDDFLFLVAYRLNGLDPIATVAAGHGENLHKYVSITNDVKSFINIVVPGTPFPEALEMSKTFGIVYRGYPEAFLEQYYVTWMWMLWGDCYAMFGFVGGLFWMGFVCAVFAAGYRLLVAARWRPVAFFRVLYLFFTYSLVVSFGLDTVAATAVYYAIPLGVLLTLCGVFTPYAMNLIAPPLPARRAFR